jgi:hypothetical protein
MRIRPAVLLVVAGALAASACASLSLPRRAPRLAGRPVALVADGPPVTSAVRAAAAREVERALGRPVRVLDAAPSPADADTKALAARLLPRRPPVARYDWREPQCAGEQRLVLAAVQHGAEAVYRVTLRSAEHERPATDAEWSDLDARRFGFRRTRRRPHVREELLTGGVVRTAFVAEGATRRGSLYRRRVARAEDSTRIDVAVAVADAVRELGPPPPAQWDAVARGLLRDGCPFLALGVAETLVAEPAREAVRREALAAMRARVERRARPPRPDAAAAATAEEVPEPAADAAPSPAEASCEALCAMHMIEICNANTVLWNANRAPWEPTPCGTRREEPFLAQCYREQWDTGTFETSCVQPCESSAEGRARLTAILRDAGCMPGPGPS